MGFHLFSWQYFKDFSVCFYHYPLPQQTLRSKAERGDPLLAERWRLSPQPRTGRWGARVGEKGNWGPEGTKVSPFSIPVELLQMFKSSCCPAAKLCPTLCGLQRARLLGPSLSPGICSISCPWTLWCHLTISSSAAYFSFCLQSFSASGSFPVSRLFPSGGQSVGASASGSALPMSIQGWFPLGLIGLIFL